MSGVDSTRSKALPRNNPSPWTGPWPSLLAPLRAFYFAPRVSSFAHLTTTAATGQQSGSWQPTSDGSPAPPRPSSPKHIIFFANGLFGSPRNWKTVLEEIQKQPGLNEVLLYPSQANSRTGTFDGIDVCGQRLADEMKSVVSQHQSLQRISVIGHSMGGLMLRYAVAQLFNPQSNTIAGLTPTHFITLATPHLGCDADGVAQVPFIGWAGPLLAPLLQRISAPTAAALFRRTGLQFFLEDPAPTPGKAKPLLLRMTEDDPDQGLFFYSALGSFVSRTAYANTGQDHLVGWQNSSLRFCHELPELPEEHVNAKGVVLADDVMAAFDTVPQPEARAPRPGGDGNSGRPSASQGSKAGGPGGPGSTSSTAVTMLERLQQLPWRRIDVSFKGSPLSILSHNHIQVTRRWLNFEGRSVAVHLAEQLVALEAASAQLEAAAAGAGGRTATSQQLQQPAQAGAGVFRQRARASEVLEDRGGAGSGWFAGTLVDAQQQLSVGAERSLLTARPWMAPGLPTLLQLEQAGEEVAESCEEHAAGEAEDTPEPSLSLNPGCEAPFQSRGQSASEVEQPAR